MKVKLINESISQLRKKGKRVLTNAFGHFVWDKEAECVISDESIIVFDEDHGVKRLFFYSVNLEDLCETIKNVKPDSKCCLEILTKDKDEYTNLFESAGLSLKSYMMRMANRDISSVLLCEDGVISLYEDGHGITPNVEDAATINEVLWNIFDTRISHLLSDEEIAEDIQKDQFRIEKNNKQIVSILQFIKEPRKFYINQIYNSDNSKVVHSILIQELTKYVQEGGKYVYAWVEENNIASVKFHSKYGLEHDGLWNVVYVGKDED